MKELVDHILRPRLPWRSPADPALTECGYDASKVNTLSREEFFKRLSNLGQQRCALLTCMTCSDTAKRWPTWNDDPRKAMEREITWECGWRRTNGEQRLRDELLAISALIEAHQEQFAGMVLEIQQRRAWNEKKKAKPANRNRKWL